MKAIIVLQYVLVLIKMGYFMVCKDFIKDIPRFLNNTFTYKELKNFLAHMDSCEECNEELSIQILVTECVARLEQGDVFDLQNEIEEKLEEAKSRKRMHDFQWKLIINMFGVALFAFFIFLLVYFGFDI